MEIQSLASCRILISQFSFTIHNVCRWGGFLICKSKHSVCPRSIVPRLKIRIPILICVPEPLNIRCSNLGMRPCVVRTAGLSPGFPSQESTGEALCGAHHTRPHPWIPARGLMMPSVVHTTQASPLNSPWEAWVVRTTAFSLDYSEGNPGMRPCVGCPTQGLNPGLL